MLEKLEKIQLYKNMNVFRKEKYNYIKTWINVFLNYYSTDTRPKIFGVMYYLKVIKGRRFWFYQGQKSGMAVAYLPIPLSLSDPKSKISFGNPAISEYFSIWQFSDLNHENYFQKSIINIVDIYRPYRLQKISSFSQTISDWNS